MNDLETNLKNGIYHDEEMVRNVELQDGKELKRVKQVINIEDTSSQKKCYNERWNWEQNRTDTELQELVELSSMRQSYTKKYQVTNLWHHGPQYFNLWALNKKNQNKIKWTFLEEAAELVAPLKDVLMTYQLCVWRCQFSLEEMSKKEKSRKRYIRFHRRKALYMAWNCVGDYSCLTID